MSSREEWLPDRAASAVRRGRDGWYRPDELLVDVDVEPHLPDLLASVGIVGPERYQPGRSAPWRDRTAGPVYDDINARLADSRAPQRLWSVPEPDGRELHDAVAELRARGAGVRLNHVFTGEDWYHGGPDGKPLPEAAPADWAIADAPAATAIHLAVLDTALPPDWQALPANLRPLIVERYPVPARIGDPLDEDGDGKLDRQAGHGWFICGLAGRLAQGMGTGIGIEVGTVLHATGEGDEALIALALLETTAPVVNLSLGAYTDGDAEPTALTSAVRRVLARGGVVVAAAGNDGENERRAGRPWWPACLPEVVAVGAYDSTGDEPVLAPFSNRGPWVDVYAPGVRLRSGYVAGWADRAGSGFAGWASWSGTSFATPLVAADLARRIAGDPDTPAAAHRDQLLAELAPVPESWTGITGKLFAPPHQYSRW